MGKELIFYYDVICPYANLALKLVEDAAKRNKALLRLRPVSYNGIHKLNAASPQLPGNTKPRTYSEQKSRVLADDLAIQYKRHHMKMNRSSFILPDICTSNAMRLIAAVPDDTSGLRKQLTSTLFDAVWTHNQDISDHHVLQSIADSLALDIDVEHCLQNEVAKQMLDANTQEAVDRGAFDVPSMYVNDRLYFGGDRLFLVEQELGNEKVDARTLLSEPLPNVSHAKLTVYFDFASPWAYIGFKRLPALLKQVSGVKVDIEWVPMLVGGLFKEIGTPLGPVAEMTKNRRKYFFTDLYDHSQFYGIQQFQLTTHFPLRTVLPCRLAIANPCYEMMETIYDAVWVHDLDISNTDVLRKLLSESGYDFDDLLSTASRKEVKEKLHENMQRALEAGACGVPSFQVNDGQLLFGQDRLNVVKDMIYGWKYEK